MIKILLTLFVGGFLGLGLWAFYGDPENKLLNHILDAFIGISFVLLFVVVVLSIWLA